MKGYLGVDVGSVSTKLIVVDDNLNVLTSIYTSTAGRPIEMLQQCLRTIQPDLDSKLEIAGGTTGSGRGVVGNSGCGYRKERNHRPRNSGFP